MIDRHENFILTYTKSHNYTEYYDDIIHFLKINHNNIQNLLVNKKLDFQDVKYYSDKKNKLLHENMNDSKFTRFLVHILNYIYNKTKSYDLTHNTLKILNTKLLNIGSELNNCGCSILNNIFDRNKCKKIINNLNNKQFINRNNNSIKNIELFSQNKNIWWLHNNNELLNIDVVQHIITSEYLLKIAENYLGCNPILHNISFWASYPGDVDTTQTFHQDFDDIKFLKIFFYLNDVDNNNGPHVYVKNSLDNMNLIQDENNKLSQRYDDNKVNKIFKDNIIKICGDTGSMIFEDTHGLHKGTNVKEGKRFVLQLIYGVSTYYYLKNNIDKYNCSIKQNNIIYQKYLKYPYNFMNFSFNQ